MVMEPAHDGCVTYLPRFVRFDSSWVFSYVIFPGSLSRRKERLDCSRAWAQILLVWPLQGLFTSVPIPSPRRRTIPCFRMSLLSFISALRLQQVNSMAKAKDIGHDYLIMMTDVMTIVHDV